MLKCNRTIKTYIYSYFRIVLILVSRWYRWFSQIGDWKSRLRSTHVTNMRTSDVSSHVANELSSVPSGYQSPQQHMGKYQVWRKQRSWVSNIRNFVAIWLFTSKYRVYEIDACILWRVSTCNKKYMFYVCVCHKPHGQIENRLTHSMWY